MIADREHELAAATPPAPAAPGEGPRRWKWTGDDLIRLGALGVLPVDRKFELMDGEIIEIMAPSPQHASLVAHISSYLARLAWNSAAHVRRESPIRLQPHSDPQPDVTVAKGNELDYLEHFPEPAEILLLVEVADTSLGYDRGTKLQTYAAAGIAEYWIVNVREAQVEVYRESDGQSFRLLRIHKPGETVTPLEAPDAEVAVNVLLGRE